LIVVNTMTMSATDQPQYIITQAQTNSAVRCMDDDTVRSFLNRIASLGVAVIRKPETGLLMMNVTDCFNTDFHLGEVLVTSAEVKLKGIKGWGMSMGDVGDRALLLACLDALSRCRESEFLLEFELLIRPWIEKAEAQQEKELKMAAATKVNFESMVTEE